MPDASGEETLVESMKTGAGGTKFIIGSPLTNTLSQSGSKYLSRSCCERLVKFKDRSRSASNKLLNGDLRTHVAATPDARWNVPRTCFASASFDHDDMVQLACDLSQLTSEVGMKLPRGCV